MLKASSRPLTHMPMPGKLLLLTAATDSLIFFVCTGAQCKGAQSLRLACRQRDLLPAGSLMRRRLSGTHGP